MPRGRSPTKKEKGANNAAEYRKRMAQTAKNKRSKSLKKATNIKHPAKKRSTRKH
jgi:hypothetical protein